MFQNYSSLILEILKALNTLLHSDVIKLLSTLQLQLPLFANRPGGYEVLEHHVRLEILDTKGKKAIYYKQQKVRFLQDNVIAYQDKAWGVGDIFVDYKCSPGLVVDRYREGYRYRVLISLRATKNRGDVEEFHIERTILNGFMQADEDLQTDVDHRMYHLSLSVIFPEHRPPKEVKVIEQKANRSILLDSRSYHRLSDGRTRIKWSTSHPRLYEAYILAWHW